MFLEIIDLFPGGVAGTPWYMVNGVDTGTNPSTLITKEDWIEYIDDLLTY